MLGHLFPLGLKVTRSMQRYYDRIGRVGQDTPHAAWFGELGLRQSPGVERS